MNLIQKQNESEIKLDFDRIEDSKSESSNRKGDSQEIRNRPTEPRISIFICKLNMSMAFLYHQFRHSIEQLIHAIIDEIMNKKKRKLQQIVEVIKYKQDLGETFRINSIS